MLLNDLYAFYLKHRRCGELDGASRASSSGWRGRAEGAAPTDIVAGSPLGAFVEYIKDCRSVADLKAKCSALMSDRVS